jgi:hypothetical protein
MRRILAILFLATVGCSDTETPGDDHDHDHDHDNELMNEVILNFESTTGGDDVVITWTEDTAETDLIVLSDADDYSLSLGFWNTLGTEDENVTIEINDEADEHQVFFTGGGVVGPASDSMDAIVTQSYSDFDSNGLPVGLENTITTDAVGTGEFIVTLRHMPPESGVAVKTETLADDVLADGFSAIGGNNDVQLTFTIEVQ